MNALRLMPPLLLASLLAAAPVVEAQAPTALDRGYVGIGAFVSRISLDGRAEIDGEFDNRRRRFADDFALGESRRMLMAEFGWSPWERHEFGVRLLRDSYRRTIQLSEELRFEGETFPVEVDLTARTRFSALELDYTWWAYATPEAAVGLQLGVLRLQAGLDLSGSIVANGNGEATIDASASRRLYAPLVGIAGRKMFGDHVRGFAELRAIELRYKRIDGTALAGSAGIDWFFADRWAVTVQYADTRIRADHDRGVFDGRAELGLRGPQVLLKTRW
jgi:hypothetical protein